MTEPQCSAIIRAPADWVGYQARFVSKGGQGGRCSRQATEVVDNRWYCWQHAKHARRPLTPKEGNK